MDFIFDPSLVLYLPLYELDGASFMSKDAYGHLCTVTGTLWTPRGRYFDGSDDWINCGNPATLQFASADAFSILAWIKPDLLNYRVILSKMETAGDYKGYMFNTGSLVAQGSDKLELVLRVALNTNNIFIYSDDPISTDTWTMVGFTYDGSLTAAGVKLYGDGNILAYTIYHNNLTGELQNTTEDVLIGVRGTEKDYKGLMGELVVYNRALTPLEIQHNYLATKWRYR